MRYNIIMESFSNDNNSNKNLVEKKLISFHPLKLCRVYLKPLNLSNVGNFSWTWILKDFIQIRMFTSPIKRRIRRFHANRQWTSKKCNNVLESMTHVTVELLFCS